jgi:hypothetical protein
VHACGDSSLARLYGAEEPSQFWAVPSKPALDVAQGFEFVITEHSAPPDLPVAADPPG